MSENDAPLVQEFESTLVFSISAHSGAARIDAARRRCVDYDGRRSGVIAVVFDGENVISGCRSPQFVQGIVECAIAESWLQEIAEIHALPDDRIEHDARSIGVVGDTLPLQVDLIGRNR